MTSDSNVGHPRFRVLLDHRDGLLSERRRAEVDTHLAAGCVACAREVASIGDLLAGIGAGVLPAPPVAAVRRARGLFVTRRMRVAVERVLASLVFDERLSPAPALRSVVGSARRLLYRTDGVEASGALEVYVELSRARDGWTMMGEFLPERDDGRVPAGVVFVRSGERVLARVDLSADGSFVAEGLPDGVLAVEGRVNDCWIDLPPIATE